MSDTKSLPADDTMKLQSGDDLATQALADSQQKQIGASADDEAEQSDQYAETLSALEGLIERNANQLEEIRQEIKERREMLKNYFENDAELSTAEEEAKAYSQQIKERKQKLHGEPQAVELQTRMKELSERSKEIEDTLSNHLLKHFQMTNSTSFDTSDGDQWEYTLKAKVKARPKH
jgi:DNA repair exonuclease SbcCD ATPase subunit